MKKRIKYLTTVLCGILALVSCMQKELDVSVKNDDNVAPQGKVRVQFNIEVPTLEANLSTKAETRDSLPAIQTMHVAVFGSSGYLKEYTEATLVQKATQNYSSSKPNVYTYEVDLTLTNSSIKVHFLGNYDGDLSFDYESNMIPLLYKTVNDTRTDGYWQRITVPNGIQAMKYNGVSFSNTYTDSSTGQQVSVTRTGESYTDDNGLPVGEGDYIDAKGNKITNGEGYIVSTQTTEDFSGVKLVRNFAKISVRSTYENFKLLSYAVINAPNQGTLAPYESDWIDYLSYTDEIHGAGYDAYSELAAVYGGSEVIGTTYNSTIPNVNYFLSPNPAVEPRVQGVNSDGVGNPSYIYERRAPSGSDDTPTVLIVYGEYYTRNSTTNEIETTTKCYYKIDLMEKGEYLTLYRNFQYDITIKSILKPGKDTPQKAFEGAGSGDISSDINASTLTDISDGTVRLYVLEMAPVIVGQQDDYEIQYKFITDVSQGDSSVNNYVAEDGHTPYSITFSGGDGTGEVIDEFSVDSNAGDDESGYFRTLHFKTKAPSGSSKKETFRITAKHTTGSGDNTVVHTLTRDIVFTLLNVQTLWVKCIPGEVEKGTDKNMTVRITIPTGLPRSMFPLQFAIEPENKSIDPRYDVDQNLPVQHGTTYQYTETVTGTGSVKDTTRTRLSFNSYYFIRELTYDEYSNYSSSSYPYAGSEVSGTMYFDSFFKTIKENSESDVYVGCLRPVDANGDPKSYDYFKPGKDNFTNYTIRDFTWTNTPEYWIAGTASQALTFRVNTAEVPDEIFVTLSNLSPASSGSNLSGTATEGVYKVSGTPAADGTVTIYVSVPDLKGYDVAVGLSALHYNDNNSLSGTIGKWVTGVVTTTHDETATLSTTGNVTSGNNNGISWTGSNVSDGYSYLTINVNSGGKITLTSTTTRDNFTISKVVFTFYRSTGMFNGTTYYSSSVTASGGSASTTSYAVSGTNNTTGTWTGTAGSGLSFTFNQVSNNNPRITRMVVSYSYTTTGEQTYFDTTKD